ncbi:trypsin-1-like isoform X3 [Contarinia nasturtii]|uniref:trypsin-1-like isoform X3 n=1 Tax=Contarinia nasturtii TaxID=265458 RepID=UPI0012D3ABF4|nr:trypsin-1-like isoform X3 [Contarinia nasturtii]XP_031625874.1 trypsin-1-like isoform X3 [Contarinia nasturtii]
MIELWAVLKRPSKKIHGKYRCDTFYRIDVEVLLLANHGFSRQHIVLTGPLSVRVGSTNLNSGGTIISVKRIHQHEEYNARTLNNDFSLLELAESLTYTDQIQPIALAAANTIIKDGTMAMVSGWGATHTNESNEVLRAAFVPIVNRSQCRRAYGGGITFRMICAGYEAGKKDSCQVRYNKKMNLPSVSTNVLFILNKFKGDSGGPLTYQNVRKGERELIGVVSFGNGCAKAQYPGVYSRVPAVRQWIKNKSGI